MILNCLKLLCIVVNKDISETLALLILSIASLNTPQENHLFRNIFTIKIIERKSNFLEIFIDSIHNSKILETSWMTE